jgi:hypothetical protein
VFQEASRDIGDSLVKPETPSGLDERGIDDRVLNDNAFGHI